MKILKNYDLTKLNTFGIPIKTKFFVELNNPLDLSELFASSEFKNNKKLFLGGGSNILFTRDFDGIVVLNKLKGIEILEETKNDVLIKATGGEVWHDLVIFTVERGYWGIENLSFIPGTVGAAPMQNIGAYGAELANVLESVSTCEVGIGEKRIFSKIECELSYRDSIFKNKLKDKYFIFSITLRLSKIPRPNITYKILKEYLEQNEITVSSPKDISDAVTAIRKSKLPDPKVIGNAGSFFKNVFLTEQEMKFFIEKHPEAPYFKEGEGFKIPGGWLIEQCGPREGGVSWKGYRIGNVGVHDKQALVIVNHLGASGEEVKNLAEQIITSVESKFGLKLIPEVNFI